MSKKIVLFINRGKEAFSFLLVCYSFKNVAIFFFIHCPNLLVAGYFAEFEERQTWKIKVFARPTCVVVLQNAWRKQNQNWF